MAQLQADIDSGRARDKIPLFDPAAAALGTDDEAAGLPAGRKRIALARAIEDSRDAEDPNPHSSDEGLGSATYGFIGFIGLVLIVLIVGLSVA